MEKRFKDVASNRFFIFCITFLFSICLSSFFRFDYFRVAGFCFLLSVFCGIYVFRFAHEEVVRKVISFVAILVFIFTVGVFRYGIKDFYVVDSRLLDREGEELTLEVEIISEPVSKGSYREYVAHIIGYDREKVLIRADMYPEFLYGDRVLFTGILEKPSVFITKNGRLFDYAQYLSVHDIFLTLSFAQGEIASRGNGNFLKTALLSFKRTFIENFETVVPEPESALLSGILLGTQDSLGKDWENKFRTTGVSHIMVLSGYNITLVADAILKALSFASLKAALVGSALGIVLFTIAVGGGASVVRASLMALLVILARATGRNYLASRGLLLIGCVMVFVNPKLLLFDFGFQLSFLATAALIWVAPLIDPYLAWCSKKWNLREILSATLVTQIVVLPLLLYTTGFFSFVSIPVNILILPIVPIAMFFGFITGVLGFLGSWFAFPFGALSQFALFYILKIVEVFSRIELFTFSFQSFSVGFLCSMYGFLVYVFLKLKKKSASF